MKDILENSEIFQAYAKIDYCYFVLDNINKELSKPKKPIDIIIDQATGFKPIDQHKDIICKMLTEIIRSKKFIGVDYSNSEQMLKEMRN